MWNNAVEQGCVEPGCGTGLWLLSRAVEQGCGAAAGAWSRAAEQGLWSRAV